MLKIILIIIPGERELRRGRPAWSRGKRKEGESMPAGILVVSACKVIIKFQEAVITLHSSNPVLLPRSPWLALLNAGKIEWAPARWGRWWWENKSIFINSPLSARSFLSSNSVNVSMTGPQKIRQIHQSAKESEWNQMKTRKEVINSALSLRRRKSAFFFFRIKIINFRESGINSSWNPATSAGRLAPSAARNFVMKLKLRRGGT